MRTIYKLIGLFTLWLGSSFAETKPNIILIMSDDMGYSDLGCYGSEIQTPRLDRLAANGLRYTQFYNTGRCCPTRASLLTGLYAHQAGIGEMTNDGGQPGYRGDLSRNAVTIAEVLKPAGYRTYMSGKWHVAKTSHRMGTSRTGRCNGASTASTEPSSVREVFTTHGR